MRAFRDTNINDADAALELVQHHLERGVFDPRHVAAVIDDARDCVVRLVEDFRPPYRKWVNELDAARQAMNTAIRLIDLGWAATEVSGFVRSAREHLQLANIPEGDDVA